MKNVAIYNALENIKGAKFIGLTYAKSVKMNLGGRKHDNPLWNSEVLAISEYNLVFNYEYERAVRNRLQREGLTAEGENFKAAPMQGLQWDIVNKTMSRVNGDGTIYVRAYEIKGGKCHSTFSHYEVDGHIATPEETEIIGQWQPPYKPSFSAKQADFGLTDEGQQVLPKSFLLDNIRALRVSGTEIVADHEPISVAL